MRTLRYPNLIAPGVVLHDIAPAPGKNLETGVPVFLGIAQAPNSPPEGLVTPKMLTLWTQFAEYFHQSFVSPYLTYAVRGFFENGGRLCYILLLKDGTLGELRNGLQAIEALNIIDLVCAPDIMQTLSPTEAIEMQSLVLEHCDKMGDRFAILDSFNVADIETINLQRQRLVGDNGALYAPWLKVENFLEYVPPCGHLAGIYARSDREAGVHRAPANYLLEGVLDLSLLVSDLDWQRLNLGTGSGVNCIRSFRSRGIRVWGARTVSRVSEWQYVNIRRLIVTVLRWADRNLADVVFEPNDISVWIRIERELTVYCESLWEQGALQGVDPEQAFYIKCDEETNAVEVRNAGQVVTEIGLAPTTPAEFIVISLIHGNSGITFSQS